MVAPKPLYDGKYCVGWIRGNVFRKEKAEQLKTPPGYTIDKDVFGELKRYGIDTIQMKDKVTGREYVCSYRTFAENCLVVDRKNGKNAVLALGFWRMF
jgi:hypothetical protein